MTELGWQAIELGGHRAEEHWGKEEAL